MLKIDRPIVYSDIFNVVPLSPGHPVFKLEGWGDGSGVVDALVIKLEANAGVGAVSLSTSLMNVVDRNARTHVLTGAEIQQLKMYADNGNVVGQEGLRAANELKMRLNERGVWTKMQLKQLLTLDSAVASRLQGDKADIRVMAKALKSPGGLEKLGMIITVDLFNGNNDRFAWPHQGDNHPDMPQRFKVIGNLGNVFVSIGEGGPTPIGLDSYDPANQFNNLAEAIDVNQWPGRLLRQGMQSERRQFADDVISDLEMALGPRNRKNPFGSQNRLGTARKDRLLNGMRSGLETLQRKLVPWKTKPNCPRGLSDRIAAMGW